MNPLIRIMLACTLGVAVTACGEKPASPPAPTAAANVLPTDPALSKIYQQTCKACHANPASGAPLAGDAQAWAPRVAQGMDVLLKHAEEGYKGMPPLGSCSDCTPDELDGLIRFMSGAK